MPDTSALKDFCLLLSLVWTALNILWYHWCFWQTLFSVEPLKDRHKDDLILNSHMLLSYAGKEHFSLKLTVYVK